MIQNNDKKEFYYPNSILQYRGTTAKNDFGHELYDGQGTLYDDSGSKLYEGEFKQGAKHGIGTMYLKGKIRYRGNFSGNKKQGEGELFQDDGTLLYKGHFANDQMDGHGILYYSTQAIEDFSAFRRTHSLQEKPYYEGAFVQGMRKGQGIMYYPNGLMMYEGEFMWQPKQGYGELYADEAQTASEESLAQGHGEKIYAGYFFNDNRHGKGIAYQNGVKLAEGQFKDDSLTGQGLLFYADGSLMYEGEFVDAVQHGRGSFYNEQGKCIYQGEFFEGERLRITAATEKEIAKLQNQLHKLVGLAPVKDELQRLIDFIKMQSLRVDYGLASFPMTYHLVFTGNPGTGKTTVARIIGQIYKHLGVLSSGHFVETDRAGLVAGYVGQTALKVQQVIEKAKGGVLFIDEAYALVNDEKDAFGQEAIDSLLKAMEDLRDDLVIIVAGYEERMEAFLQANPGFKSRFNRFIQFEDYNHDELYSIFYQLCQANDYRYENDFTNAIYQAIKQIPIGDLPHFSNGRYMRNIFETLVAIQSSRLAKAEQVTREDLMTLTLADFTQAQHEKVFTRTF